MKRGWYLGLLTSSEDKRVTLQHFGIRIESLRVCEEQSEQDCLLSPTEGRTMVKCKRENVVVR